ncbi:lipid A biosynthesis acyltransferase [Elizabethkingia argentiflava]|uniref:Lipid A biosynthesis acyltransferase n=1 Tax=Elizabethkingia argenteiflava TaxID=2681556 RepID=A0A845PTG5_9FLAO|nr:lysophospholipid acyltransferase family protein [Elizabethkingia argenteiflava]NAW51104.1 lipid A biosynthesis acyltransferase [Elizabethkingia argenteiflava]
MFLNRILFQIILLCSRLPLWFLYGLSDILYYANLLFVGYRKKVVTENLRNSFPEKSPKEITQIRRRFFRNFFDYIFEMLKTFTISETELRVRMQHLNQDVFRECYEEKKDIIFLAGHVFNWEWINALAPLLPQKESHPVYRKVQSTFWEEKIKFIRNRFGNKALEAKEVLRSILQSGENGQSVYMFVADQTPHFSEIHYGLDFLNQKTPAFIGYDKLSTKKDLAFVYCDMKKVKRGYYQVNYYRIYPDGEKFKPYEVVNKFHELLENTIKTRPDNWLWSHRRWKYKDVLK